MSKLKIIIYALLKQKVGPKPDLSFSSLATITLGLPTAVSTAAGHTVSLTDPGHPGTATLALQ